MGECEGSGWVREGKGSLSRSTDRKEDRDRNFPVGM